MDDRKNDMNRELMLDGNALGSLLSEMTATPTACTSCGYVAEVGVLLAFTQAPGLVCPTGEMVILRIVQTPTTFVLTHVGRPTCASHGRPDVQATNVIHVTISLVLFSWHLLSSEANLHPD